MAEKAIIARICGGLGNQLFIYAMARRLALGNGAMLKLDIISGFKNDLYKRNYLLKYFNIKADIADSYESFESGLGQIRRRTWMSLAQLRKFEKRQYIIEENKCFDPRIMDIEISKKVYLQGLWQSEQYFKDIEDIIRQDLEIVRSHDNDTIKLAERIKNVNSISIHARSYNEVLPDDGSTTLPLDYYNRAVDVIAQNVLNPQLFCFSDNPDWLREYLKLDFPIKIVSSGTSDEDGKTIDDLWLMSQCRHHIIANSTFSWWGAWLKKSLDKIVIAPGGGWNNRDLIPSSWVKI